MSELLLSIPVGMMVENALSSGEPVEVIIGLLNRREFAPLISKVKEPEMPFGERLDTAVELNDPWEAALRSGYSYKFLHIGGVKRLLNFRWGRQQDVDYVQEGTALRQLKLYPEDKALLQSLIGRQWLVRETEDTVNTAYEAKDCVVQTADHAESSNECDRLLTVSVELKYQ